MALAPGARSRVRRIYHECKPQAGRRRAHHIKALQVARRDVDPGLERLSLEKGRNLVLCRGSMAKERGIYQSEKAFELVGKFVCGSQPEIKDGSD